MTMQNVEVPGFASTWLSPIDADDVAELLVLQRCCWVQEALANQTLDIAPLTETLEQVRAWTKTWMVWRVRMGPRLVAAVRARSVEPDYWEIGRLMVAPDLAGHGLGRWLLGFAEDQAPPTAGTNILFTGARSHRNIVTYERAGYQRKPSPPAPFVDLPGVVHLTKPRR